MNSSSFDGFGESTRWLVLISNKRMRLNFTNSSIPICGYNRNTNCSQMMTMKLRVDEKQTIVCVCVCVCVCQSKIIVVNKLKWCVSETRTTPTQQEQGNIREKKQQENKKQPPTRVESKLLVFTLWWCLQKQIFFPYSNTECRQPQLLP